LIGELFELMHELHFARDLVAGADFVMGVLAEVLPCEVAMIQVFNINTRQFVVIRAHGNGLESALLHATPDSDPMLADDMRRGRSRAFKTEGDSRFASGRFKSLKAPLRELLCGPVRQGGRYLGTVELGNPAGGTPFHESETNALDYICEQFAEFVASRPVVLDPDVILAR
jgi:GAF domain-containing protein